VKTSFSELPLTSAEHLHPGFLAAAADKRQAMKIEGAWVNRRLVIVKITPVLEMPEHPANPLAMILYVRSSARPVDVVNACRSFGTMVERLWRDSDRRKFDRVVSGEDGDRHYVRAFHHVALCGHKPNRWLTDAELGAILVEVQPCAKCVAMFAFEKSSPRAAPGGRLPVPEGNPDGCR
jgi:hypothetical protein